MLCPKCKSPIEDDVTVCEWCGVSLYVKKETVFCPICKNSINENAVCCEWCGVSLSIKKETEINTDKDKISNLDGKIIRLLTEKKYPIHAIVRAYKKRTGKSLQESYYYILRLEFFRTHSFVTEKEWQKEWLRIERIEKEDKMNNNVILYIVYLVPLICILIYFLTLFV